MLNKIRNLVLVVGLCSVLIASANASAATSLRCEYRENPLGIDVANPRLSWIIEGQSNKVTEAQSGRGIKQAAYQVRAASPGYKTIIIRPLVGEGITWVNTYYDSCLFKQLQCNRL